MICMRDDLRGRMAGVLLVITLAACGGDDNDRAAVGPRQVERGRVGPDRFGRRHRHGRRRPAVQPPGPYADLALASNRAGGTVQLRFSCARCDISVSAAGATVGANQYLSISFASLESSADTEVLVTDRAQWRASHLHAARETGGPPALHHHRAAWRCRGRPVPHALRPERLCRTLRLPRRQRWQPEVLPPQPPRRDARLQEDGHPRRRHALQLSTTAQRRRSA